MRDALLGIEQLTVPGLPPVEFVDLAADLDCRFIGIVLSSDGSGPDGHVPYSLRTDASLRRKMRAVMDDRGVAISLGDGMLVRPGRDIAARAPDLDALAELGAERVGTVSFDPDRGRTFDQFATLWEMADARGMETVVEFVPTLTVDSLPVALEAVRHVGQRSFRVLVDTMHLVRSGSGADDLRALDPGVIGYAQMCDVPRTPRFPEYMDEAMHERMVPGDGELPLRDIVAALPDDLVIGLEVPMRSAALAGVGPRQRATRCVDAARRLF